jgi:hypothetical protein
VLYLRLIIFLVGDDVFIDSETFLVTDFVNLKIKSAQSFRGTHRNTIYMHIFIGVNVHMCMNIYVSTIFLTKKSSNGLLDLARAVFSKNDFIVVFPSEWALSTNAAVQRKHITIYTVFFY